jgi:hypothetical protein
VEGNPTDLFQGIFDDVVIDDPIARQRFRAKWLGVLGATYGAVPDIDEVRVSFEAWGSIL